MSDDESAALDSLELGVAGLVYALATVRILPAAGARRRARCVSYLSAMWMKVFGQPLPGVIVRNRKPFPLS
jgi:hypothetical protein